MGVDGTLGHRRKWGNISSGAGKTQGDASGWDVTGELRLGRHDSPFVVQVHASGYDHVRRVRDAGLTTPPRHAIKGRRISRRTPGFECEDRRITF